MIVSSVPAATTAEKELSTLCPVKLATSAQLAVRSSSLANLRPTALPCPRTILTARRVSTARATGRTFTPSARMAHTVPKDLNSRRSARLATSDPVGLTTLIWTQAVLLAVKANIQTLVRTLARTAGLATSVKQLRSFLTRRAARTTVVTSVLLASTVL